MTDLLTLQKSFILSHLKEGDVCADFTMGNGHDTLFLSNTVKESGHVYAFDIQEGALVSTKKRLETEGSYKNYTLIHDSHHNLKKYIDRKIKAGMFNLGYLPGSNNKALTTKRETTLPAVKDALDMLDSDGILLIAVYPGHAEGYEEGVMLKEYFSTLSRLEMSISQFQIVNSPTSPYFFIVEKK
jgi:hypothetical protein